MQKPRILISVDWFEPGYKAGGPIRSCLNLSRALKGNYQIFVITSDTDFGEIIPYNSVESNKWVKLEEGIEVYYFNKKHKKFGILKEIVEEINPDFIYLNSIFSIFFSLHPLLLKWLGKYKNKIIIAPRGMLHKGSLKFKPLKKNIFLMAFKLLGLYKTIIFQATDIQEKKDIYTHFGMSSSVYVIPNISEMTQPPFQPSLKAKGKLSILFCSRISPKKNLYFLIKILKKVKANINLSIVGPIEDEIYWNKCKIILDDLPENIQYEFKGQLPHHLVKNELQDHNLFCLPTLGENFGHSIIEAFIVGRPVLISTNTPWRNLKKLKIGWDVSLDNPEQYIATFEIVAKMDQSEFSEWCQNAWSFANNLINKSNLKESYYHLFS